LVPAVTGGLDAGRYQVAITFVGDDGIESGASLASVVDVADGGGIILSNIPQGDAEKVNLYMTEANGDKLFLRQTLVMGQTSAKLSKGLAGKVLTTQFLAELPPGQVLRHYRGRMYTAVDAAVFYSEPFLYGLTRPSRNFLHFPTKVTVVEPVVDGIYVVADQTYFITAPGTPEMQQLVVDSAGGVIGTGLTADAYLFGLEPTMGKVACWFGSEGLMVGTPGGKVIRMTEGRIAFDGFGYGASLIRKHAGIQQLLTTVFGEESGFAASDSAVAEVRRNGVIV
jgi:hypothetical protein